MSSPKDFEAVLREIQSARLFLTSAKIQLQSTLDQIRGTDERLEIIARKIQDIQLPVKARTATGRKKSTSQGKVYG